MDEKDLKLHELTEGGAIHWVCCAVDCTWLNDVRLTDLRLGPGKCERPDDQAINRNPG
jgi:hypothetical protein